MKIQREYIREKQREWEHEITTCMLDMCDPYDLYLLHVCIP